MRHLTSHNILEAGFIFFEKRWYEKGQGWSMVYKRGDDLLSYDGTWWVLNGKKINYFEEL
jgi:hypothetical protein